jgi:hypothetical protein
LAGAAGGAARYFADAAGMEAGAVVRLQDATLAVCSAVVTQISKTNQAISVEVTRFADRIEISIGYPGSAVEHLAELPGVDRMTQESLPAGSLIRLTKSL